MIQRMKQGPWRMIVLVFGLMLFDISVHPLTAGPDRLIHDPAVYRLGNPNYLPGDWYTAMAVKSQVYIFYAKLVNFSHALHLPEELWRTLLYLGSLVILYYALVRIARFFSPSVWVVPIIAVLHMFISTGNNQPVWLYGPFLQVDGGLAPRSIGIALSFLALSYLMRGSLLIPSLLLGLATLIHVSNSFIVFSLFLVAWGIARLSASRPTAWDDWLAIIRKAGVGVGVYLLAGGWFALYVALVSRGAGHPLTADKFIWAWIYLRAPYMALPLITKYWWIRLFAHLASVVIGWWILRQRVTSKQRVAVTTLSIVGVLAVAYFFIFYLFAFIVPWLPGFQFYSLRVVYLAYFVAYLFIGLSLLFIGQDVVGWVYARTKINARYIGPSVLVGVVILLTLFGLRLGASYRHPTLKNIRSSWFRLLDHSVAFRSLVPENQQVRLPSYATFSFLLKEGKPFLAPPNWKTDTTYLPALVSYKSFGFTEEGLAQWLERLDAVSKGEVERRYQTQQQTGQRQPVTIEWGKYYAQLTQEDVLRLAQTYHFDLFLTYRELSYDWPVVAEDSDFRLYRLPPLAQRAEL